jgi:hypothetical protein
MIALPGHHNVAQGVISGPADPNRTPFKLDRVKRNAGIDQPQIGPQIVLKEYD